MSDKEFASLSTNQEPEASPPAATRPASLRAKLVPDELLKNSVISGKRVVLVGSCAFSLWLDAMKEIDESIGVEHVVTAAILPSEMPFAPEECAFQVASIALRAVMPEREARVGIDDMLALEQSFGRCCERLSYAFQEMTAWSDRTPVFFMNFLTPQTNLIGRFMPRYDLRNPIYFVQMLNKKLSELIEKTPNVYLLDADLLSASYGKFRLQDDSLTFSNHNGFLTDYDFGYDQDRLEPVQPAMELFNASFSEFIKACAQEAIAMFRTLRGADAIKMVCIDLDDTLWRGVMAERDFVEPSLMEGWPLGLVEALLALKKRGIILAIISKNDEARVRSFWPELMSGVLEIDDFAICKINWRPKAENVAEAIAAANILPTSVLFIDDNPVERAAVSAAIPGIRTLGAPHYLWRHILLRSPETQTVAITNESSRRTEMIKAQVLREEKRASMGHEAFLAELDLKVVAYLIRSMDDPRATRCFELINKTNQFNTTGVRWTREEAVEFFGKGGVWWAFQVADKFTSYGIVGVVIVEGNLIKQYVMSCRVLGMGVEASILSLVTETIIDRQNFTSVEGNLLNLPANGPCQGLYSNLGWTQTENVWRTLSANPAPRHVSLVVDPGASDWLASLRAAATS